MAKQIYLLFLVLLLVLPLCSADLGAFKQGQDVSIRVLANCPGLNLSEVTLTNNNIVYVINSPMTRLSGQTFNYTFINTSIPGHYTYSWDNPCIDCSSGNCGNSFDITPNGNISTVADSMTMIWQIVVLIVALICFMVMGTIFKIDGVKIFFFVLAGLTLFALVGLALSSAQNYLFSYTQYGSVYSTIYILFAIVGGTAITGLVLWFVYYAYTKFSKTRIGDFDED
jgi:hypothetical protein